MPKLYGERKDKQLAPVKVTEEEKKYITEKADSLGMTEAQYIRFCCLKCEITVKATKK